jgi:CHASE2 domain-containing sensor protein
MIPDQTTGGTNQARASSEIRSEGGHLRPSPRHPFVGFRKHYRRGLLPLLILSGLGLFMERIGLFDSINSVLFDTFAQTRVSDIKKGVLILEISNDDYKKYFNATSPLDPGIVAELVTTISGGKPGVIGVDLDTSDDLWCGSLSKLAPDALGALTNNQIVWAEVPESVADPLTLMRVLGGKLTDTDNVGIPRFPLERDGMVRRYARAFRVFSGGLPGCRNQATTAVSPPPTVGAGSAPQSTPQSEIVPMESLSTVIAKRWCGTHGSDHESFGFVCKLPESTYDPAIFNLQGGRNHLLITDVADFMLPPMPDPGSSPAQAQAVQDERNKAKAEIQTRLQLLQNEIVLIGGNYREARDNYFTPVGEKAGVELVAEAILADLGGHPVNSVKTIYSVAFDLFIGSFVIWLYFYFHDTPRIAFWISLGLIPFLAVLGPSLTRTGYWLDVSTIIVGLILDQMFELSGRVKEYREETAALEAELQGMRSQLAANSATETRDLKLDQRQSENPTEAIVILSTADSDALGTPDTSTGIKLGVDDPAIEEPE